MGLQEDGTLAGEAEETFNKHWSPGRRGLGSFSNPSSYSFTLLTSHIGDGTDDQRIDDFYHTEHLGPQPISR